MISRLLTTALAALALAAPALAQTTPPADLNPDVVSDANAGTTPIHRECGLPGVSRTGRHFQSGRSRIVKLYHSDARLKDIFAAADDDRLHRHLTEQICYVTGGPCHYTGRDMQSAHRDMGVQQAELHRRRICSCYQPDADSER